MAPFVTFKNFAQGVQGILVAISLIVGGIWTFVTFDLLRAPERAREEIKILKQELERRGDVRTEINARQIKTAKQGEFLIAATFILINTGNRSVQLNLTGRPFSVARVEFSENAKPVFSEIIYPQSIVIPPFDSPHKIGHVSSMSIEPKGRARIPLIVKVPGPGLYFVQSDIKISDLERRKMFDEGRIKSMDDPSSWKGYGFVTVK